MQQIVLGPSYKESVSTQSARTAEPYFWLAKHQVKGQCHTILLTIGQKYYDTVPLLTC